MNPEEIKAVATDLKEAAQAFTDTRALVEKSQSEIEQMKTDIDALAKIASRPGGGANDGSFVTAEQKEHADAFVEWLREPMSDIERANLAAIEQKTATSLTDSAGGYGVPEAIAGPLLRRARDANTLRQIVRVVQVQTPDVRLVLSNSDATQGWVGETDTRNDTATPTLIAPKPTFGTNFALIEATEELAMDFTFNLQGWFAVEAGDALAEAEATSIVTGDGVNKPTGILSVAPESDADGSRSEGAFQYLPSGSAATLGSDAAAVQDLLADMIYGLKARYRRAGRWVMNSATAGTLRKLKDGDNRMLWSDGLAAGEPSRLLGYPVTVSEAMPDIGANEHPIGFGDWRAGYVLADRGALRVTVDNNITKPGFVRWYIRRRVGGIAHDNNAIRFAKCATS